MKFNPRSLIYNPVLKPFLMLLAYSLMFFASVTFFIVAKECIFQKELSEGYTWLGFIVVYNLIAFFFAGITFALVFIAALFPKFKYFFTIQWASIYGLLFGFGLLLVNDIFFFSHSGSTVIDIVVSNFFSGLLFIIFAGLWIGFCLLFKKNKE